MRMIKHNNGNIRTERDVNVYKNDIKKTFILKNKNSKIFTKRSSTNKHLLIRLSNEFKDALSIIKQVLERNIYDKIFLTIKYDCIKRLNVKVFSSFYEVLGYEVFVGYVPGRIKENEYVCLYRIERIK